MTPSPVAQAQLGDVAGSATLAVGGSVEVRLPAALGAGFSWSIPELPAGLRLIEKRVMKNDSTLEGRNDVQVFELRGETPGRYELRFVYRRPFEPSEAPKRTLTHVIVVTPAS